MIRVFPLIAFFAWSFPVLALELQLPANAQQTLEREVVLGSYDVPMGRVENEKIPSTLIEGQINTQAWRIVSSDLTTLQILEPLRSQLTEDGFTILFDCASDSCGGFDFRFATDVVPAPNMYVDIRDYRFVSAAIGPIEAPDEAVTVLVSRSSGSGFIQIVHASKETSETVHKAKVPSQLLPRVEATSGSELADELVKEGHVILADLHFTTGSSNLSSGDFSSLEALAAYLSKNPNIKIALVGHTDSQGALSNNIALSKKRAQSVVERLATVYTIPRAQMQAEGMGYLAPVASNLTQEGRDLNRRVEAILLSAE